MEKSEPMTMDMPKIKLLPKVDSKSIRFGAPWVYRDQLVMDRRTRAIPAGQIVDLYDGDQQFLARGAFNSESKISFRVLTRDEVNIDQEWLKVKLQRAQTLRERIYPTPHYRWVHGEADGLPGLVIDRFDSIAVIQPNAAWIDSRKDDLTASLIEMGVETVIMNGQGRARKLEGLSQETIILSGSEPDLQPVPMNGAIYIADLIAGQKTGLFYDQRDNHAFLQRFAKDAEVIDVFSHVGGFGLATLAAGAASVKSVDASEPALMLAQKGAEAMQSEARFSVQKGDAFDVMQEDIDAGKHYDIVICDPPAFAPAKSALSAGLRAYERVARQAALLTAPGGILVLCSCSHAASPEKFDAASLRGIGKAGRNAQILHRGAAGPDHPTHPYLIESGYLKSLFMRLD